MRGRMIRPKQGARAALASGSPATPASGVLASATGYPSLSVGVNNHSLPAPLAEPPAGSAPVTLFLEMCIAKDWLVSRLPVEDVVSRNFRGVR